MAHGSTVSEAARGGGGTRGAPEAHQRRTRGAPEAAEAPEEPEEGRIVDIMDAAIVPGVYNSPRQSGNKNLAKQNRKQK